MLVTMAHVTYDVDWLAGAGDLHVKAAIQFRFGICVTSWKLSTDTLTLITRTPSLLR